MLFQVSSEFTNVFQGLKIESWKSLIQIGTYLASAGFAVRALSIFARAATTGSSEENVKGFWSVGYAIVGYAGVTALMNALG